MIIGQYLDKEGDGFPAIEKTVVVGESEIHHLHVMLVRIQRSISGQRCAYRADFDLAVDNDWSFLDSVETENSCYMLVSSHIFGSENKPVWGKLMMGVPINEPKTPPYAN